MLENLLRDPDQRGSTPMSILFLDRRSSAAKFFRDLPAWER
jgi:hypothetical protein